MGYLILQFRSALRPQVALRLAPVAAARLRAGALLGKVAVTLASRAALERCIQLLHFAGCTTDSDPAGVDESQAGGEWNTDNGGSHPPLSYCDVFQLLQSLVELD